MDDAYTFGRIAAANALSDVYAVGGEPLIALNLLGWPRDKLPIELAAEVLRGGLEVARSAGCHVAGGHSIDDPEPKYGMAVTGLADPARLLRIDAGAAGLPLSLTKPIGIGVLNARHKATGEVSQEAVEVMTTLNAAASRAALAAGLRCATDVTGFGLLGHLFKLARASGVSAVIDHAAVPVLAEARSALRAGYLPGGSRRNLDWVRPHADFGGLDEAELLLLADAQTSGGLLVAGELPGAPVIGELVPAGRRRADHQVKRSPGRPRRRAGRPYPDRVAASCQRPGLPRPGAARWEDAGTWGHEQASLARTGRPGQASPDQASRDRARLPLPGWPAGRPRQLVSPSGTASAALAAAACLISLAGYAADVALPLPRAAAGLVRPRCLPPRRPDRQA